MSEKANDQRKTLNNFKKVWSIIAKTLAKRITRRSDLIETKYKEMRGDVRLLHSTLHRGHDL